MLSAPSASISALAAAAAAAMPLPLAGEPALALAAMPAAAAPPAAEPTLEPLTHPQLLELIAKSWEDSTHGLPAHQTKMQHAEIKLREMSKYLSSILTDEQVCCYYYYYYCYYYHYHCHYHYYCLLLLCQEKISLLRAFTNKEAILRHLSKMPISNRKMGTTAFANVLEILKMRGPSAENSLFWEVHRVLPTVLRHAGSKACADYNKQLQAKKLARANDENCTSFQTIKDAVIGAQERSPGAMRFRLLNKAASSWMHQVRMDETEVLILILVLFFIVVIASHFSGIGARPRIASISASRRREPPLAVTARGRSAAFPRKHPQRGGQDHEPGAGSRN